MNQPGYHAVVADCVFDGAIRHDHAAVVVAGSEIAQIVPKAEVADIPAVTVLPEGVWLAPGFVDIQVNGGGDVLFNDSPKPDALSTIAAAHRRFGTTGFLPTLITDSPEKTISAIAAVQTAMRTEPSILGLHLEGPFLSREKAGVHDPAFIRQPTALDEEVLTAPRQGALVVTLAPEQVPRGFIRRLVGFRRSGLSRTFDGKLCGNARRDGRRAQRVYPSVQRDAADAKPRPRPDCRGARNGQRVHTA